MSIYKFDLLTSSGASALSASFSNLTTPPPKTATTNSSCLNAIWFLVINLEEEGNPTTYYIIQVVGRLSLSTILALRAHQINESINPGTRFFERFEVWLATIFLIAQFALEGLFLSTLFQVDCADFGFVQCKAKIDSELESHGFSNTAPSYAGMALVIALVGIFRLRLEELVNLYIIPRREIIANPQLQPILNNVQQPKRRSSLIQIFKGWNCLGIIIICLYYICRIVYWSIKGVDQPSLQLVLLILRVLISYFITYDIYFVSSSHLFYLNFRLQEFAANE
ncbi:hypothetical protein Glove_499g13 [Diversispora epigaea]|uniref:Uncharacterized protein n=1 Tax=Diversispora epigaea TaxID=1348612 RepID=A0A397GHG3_9GLOM|nr:hypothetical protein Glove_499g13 [Diversispora epigaea]